MGIVAALGARPASASLVAPAAAAEIDTSSIQERAGTRRKEISQSLTTVTATIKLMTEATSKYPLGLQREELERLLWKQKLLK